MGKRTRRSIGVAVIGCGAIGSIRANMLAQNPAVSYLAVCDIVPEKAKKLSEACGADAWSEDYNELIGKDEIDAVIVSTPEDAHYKPTYRAIALRKPVLVEKPIMNDLDEAARIIKAAKENDVKLFVGFTQRFRRRFASGKHQVASGALGTVNLFEGTMYATRAIGKAITSRVSTLSPAVDVLIYQADFMLWYMHPRKPITVSAQSVWSSDSKKGPEATWAIFKFQDGSMGVLGVTWQLPTEYPAYSTSLVIKAFGNKGTILIDNLQGDYIQAAEEPFLAAHYTGVKTKFAFQNVFMPGDWALGRFWGPMKAETEAFIESITSNTIHPVLATAEDGYDALALSHAMDRSAENGGKVLSLPLSHQRTSSDGKRLHSLALES